VDVENVEIRLSWLLRRVTVGIAVIGWGNTSSMFLSPPDRLAIFAGMQLL
jgi:hypothetical protein